MVVVSQSKKLDGDLGSSSFGLRNSHVFGLCLVVGLFQLLLQMLPQKTRGEQDLDSSIDNPQEERKAQQKTLSNNNEEFSVSLVTPPPSLAPQAATAAAAAAPPDPIPAPATATEATSSAEVTPKVDSSQGRSGGAWTWCTHARRYGFNFDVGLATFLAHQLQPQSALEFGTGMGLYVDYLVRHGQVTGPVYGSEPEDMSSAGVYQPQNASHFPRQITGNLLDPQHPVYKQPDSPLSGTFDLVYTIEVAEHLPPSTLPTLVDFLVRRTGKYLVFSAARPGQGGTGHVRGSMLPRKEWIRRLEAARVTNPDGSVKQVHYLPHLSTMLLQQCDFWNKNHRINAIVFGVAQDLDTNVKHAPLERSDDRTRPAHEGIAYKLFPHVKERIDEAMKRDCS